MLQREGFLFVCASPFRFDAIDPLPTVRFLFITITPCHPLPYRVPCRPVPYRTVLTHRAFSLRVVFDVGVKSKPTKCCGGEEVRQEPRVPCGFTVEQQLRSCALFTRNTPSQ